MEKVFITVNHLFGKVIGVKSFVRVRLIFLAIFSVPAFCANSTDDVINGEKLFLEHCHSCHATSSHQVPSKAMLDFVVLVTQASSAIEEEHRQNLREVGFSDRDIWDITNVAAFFNMTNRVASATAMSPNENYHSQAR